MKINDIRNMSTEEINTKIDELKSELLDLRMKSSMEKSHRINADRKDIARMKTVLMERKGGNV